MGYGVEYNMLVHVNILLFGRVTLYAGGYNRKLKNMI